MKVEVWGGGGGGAGGFYLNHSDYGVNYLQAARGGGGGGYSTRTWTNPSSVNSLTYAVGSGGSAGSAKTYSTGNMQNLNVGFNSGGNGVQSSASFNGVTLTGGGGTGGGGTFTTNSNGIPGTSITGSGGGNGSGSGSGATTASGQSGSDATFSYGSGCAASGNNLTSGKGGDGGSGGAGGATTSITVWCSTATLQSVAGKVGTAPAGGGSSGIGNANGGAGARGQVRITTITTDAQNPDPIVKFGANTATCTVNSNTQMTCTTPAGTAGTVAVTVGGVAAGNYTYYAAPTITGVVTATGAGVTKNFTVKSNGQWPDATIGTTRTTRTVAITGSNFSGVSAVTVGGTDCASYTVNSATSITCTLATTVKTGAQAVRVTTPGGTTTATATAGTNAVYYVAAPVVDHVAVPTDGTVKINGERKDNLSGGTWTAAPLNQRLDFYGTFKGDGFVGLGANVKVTVGGLACEVVAWTNPQIVCEMPNWGSVGNKAIQVSTTYGTSGTGVYVTAVAPPVISSITPNTGVLTTGGEVLTITGTGFQSEFTVAVEGVECASTTYVSSTSVKCTTPAGMAAGTRYVTVRTGYGSGTMGVEFVEPSLELALAPTSVGFTVSSGGSGLGYTVATVETNNPYGYELSLVSDGADLVCESSASYVIPSIASGGALAIASDKNEAWGWSVVLPAAAGGSWSGATPNEPGATTWKTIPTGAAAQIAKTSASAIAGDDYGVFFGATVNSAQAAWRYGQRLTFSAVGNI
jgi:hypothetical protein